jgi:hypothetical protein
LKSASMIWMAVETQERGQGVFIGHLGKCAWDGTQGAHARMGS